MRPLDDAAQRAEALGNHDANVVIEAGAGSGKTAIMSGRVVAMLASGVSPSSIAAITFTDAAAAQLANAIHAHVATLLDDPASAHPAIQSAFPEGGSDAQRRHLRDAAAHLDRLTIGTIHSFARDVLTSYPVEAGLDPGFTVLDRPHADALFDEELDAWLRDRLQYGASGDVIVGMVRTFGPRALTLVRTLATELRRHPTATPPEGGSLATAAAGVVQAAGDVMRREDVVGYATPTHRRHVARLDPLVHDEAFVRGDVWRVMHALMDAHRVYFTVVKNGASYGRKKVVTKGEWQDAGKQHGRRPAERDADHAHVAEAYAALSDAFVTLAYAASDHLVGRIATEVETLQLRYERAKAMRAALDFDDLLRRARDLVTERGDVRAELGQRFRVVLIDEFQDTDAMQAEIVWRITSDEDAEDWRTLPARPGARFVVGDPKQSIYRFRGADVWIYTHLRDHIASAPDGLRLAITTNFRSAASLLTFVNETYAAPMEGPSQPGYERLAPTPARLASDDRPSVARLAVPLDDAPSASDSTSASTKDVRRAEADAVAHTVAALLEGTALEGHAPYAHDHIVLLAPSFTGLEIYESALEEIGIPIASPAGKTHFRQQVTQDLVALCRTLATPADTLALGALLRGPLFGITDEELLDALDDVRAATDGAPPVGLRRDTDPRTLRNERLGAILTQLDALAHEARGRTPYQALAHALDVLNVRAIVRARDPRRSVRDLKNLEQFLEQAKGFAARGFHAFAHAMWDAWENDPRERETLPDVTEAVVSIRTIHTAKGLEWPVVIPINTFGDPPGRPSVLVSTMGREGASRPVLNVSQNVGEGGRLITSGWHAAREREALEDDAERVRLWYVAMTRAADLLILPEPVGAAPPKKAWWNAVDWASEPLPWITPRPTEPRPTSLPSGDLHAGERVPREPYARATDAILARRPAYVDVRPSDHDADDVAERSDPAPEQRRDRAPRRRDGTVRGSLVHVLFEELVRGALEPDEAALVARATELLARIEDDVGIDPEEVAATVLQGWWHPDVAAWHGRLVAEWHLRAAMPHAEGTRIVSGIADAVALDERGDVALVVDWKSDVAPNDETRNAYARQVRAYLDALNAPTGLLVFAARGDTLRVERDAP